MCKTELKHDKDKTYVKDRMLQLFEEDRNPADVGHFYFGSD